jgi:hypothetical protein
VSIIIDAMQTKSGGSWFPFLADASKLAIQAACAEEEGEDEAETGLNPVAASEKTATECDRRPGIKWVSCAAC